MKKLTALASALLLGSASQAALAGDWNGAYAGLSIGETTNVASAFDNDYYDFGSTQERTSKAVSYGLQAGINRQSGSLVLGGELSYTFTDNEDKVNFNGGTRLSNELSSILSLRARAGLAVDNALVYMTAGVAQLDAEHDYNDGPSDRMTATNDKLGVVYGFGVEAKVSDQFSLRGEILNGQNGDEADKSISGDQMTFSNEYTVVSIGGNFLF